MIFKPCEYTTEEGSQTVLVLTTEVGNVHVLEPLNVEHVKEDLAEKIREEYRKLLTGEESKLRILPNF